MQQLSQNGYTDQEVLDQLSFVNGSRRVTFHYDLLDYHNNFKSRLTNVLGCSLSNDYSKDIKRTAKFDLLDDGSINYLSDRIKPWVRVDMSSDSRAYSTIQQNAARGTVITNTTTGVLDTLFNDITGLWYFDETSGTTAVDESSANAYFYDNFSNQTVGFFPDFTNNAYYANGQGVISATGQGATYGYSSTLVHGAFDIDMSPGASMTIQVVSLPASGKFYFSASETLNYVLMECINGALSGTVDANGTFTTVQLGTYSAATMGWFRIFNSTDGNIYFQTSSDGSTFSNLGSVSASGTTLTAVKPYLEMMNNDGTGTYNPNIAPAVVDNFTYSKGASAHPGTIGSGVVTGTVGVVQGSSFTFNNSTASSGYVTVPNGHAYFYLPTAASGFKATASAFSHILWIRPSSVVNSTLWHTSDGSAQLYFDGSGNVVFYAQTASSSIKGQCFNPYGTNIRMIGVTWGMGQPLNIYLNGVAQSVTMVGDDINNPMSGVNGDLWLGYAYSGDMDSPSFFNTTISAANMFALYRSGARVGPFGQFNYAEWPQGVYLLSTPTRQADKNEVVTRSVDAYDSLQAIADDLVTSRYTVTAGTNYVTAATALLPSYQAATIIANSATLPVGLEWEPGTSKLTIINYLLAAINYESLWYDENGYPVIRPYIAPSLKSPSVTYADNQASVLLPEMSQTIDLFAIPNEWVLVQSEPNNSTVLRSVYTNSNPASPTSTVSRGRTITKFVTEQNAPNQATLDARAQQMAVADSQIYETVDMETAIMPFHSTGDIFELDYSTLQLSDKYFEIAWSFECKEGSPMKHKIQRQVNI